MAADDLLTFAVLGFIGYRLLDADRTVATGPGRQLTLRILRGVRVRHLWPVPVVLTVVVLVGSALVLIPGLSWGWWTALGGDGNPVFGSSQSTAGTVWEWILPLAFVAMLFPAIPLFAHAEERTFRAGAELWSWKRRAFKVVQFGLAHALIGIPIGYALALSIGGVYFMFVYLRQYRRTGAQFDAIMESTRAHAVYNMFIVFMFAVALIGLLLGVLH